MNSLRRIDLPQVLGILLLGGIAFLLPLASHAAPATPAEGNADADATDTIQLQPEFRFDDPRPPADADPVAGQDRNLLQGETTFDDPRPEDPPRAELPPQSAVVPNDERPTLSMNPSTGPVTVMYGQDDLRVEVYEITGRRVAAFDGSAGRAQWDGRDSYGRPVARGIYFARVMTGPGTPGAVVRIVRR
jgi:hypothetical protein